MYVQFMYTYTYMYMYMYMIVQYVHTLPLEYKTTRCDC